MLTDAKLRGLRPAEKKYKVSDRDGMYVVVLKTGVISFRYDYRHDGLRKTFSIGVYGEIGLAEARERLIEAKRMIMSGVSPSVEKQRIRRQQRNRKTLEFFCCTWLEKYQMAESTRNMRKSIIDRDILPAFGTRVPDDITTEDVRSLCDKIVARDAPATAVHVREIIQQIFAFHIERGATFTNPATAIRPSSIATFKPKDRALSPLEIGVAFRLLERVATLPTLRLALRLILLTMVRKGELIKATWDEVNFEAATWTIPKERMKARRSHVIYLSRQALDIMIALKTCAGGSPYLLPSRYEADQPISNATLNRVIDVVATRAKKEDLPLEAFTVHDLRRTASTLLHEADYNSDWIEKCLAHEQKGIRAVYNKAEYAVQRREMLQEWADMVEGFIKGATIIPIRRAA
ncbi:MAG: tyrosine-type recombinase/integrase [Zoogloeaceae bacterium]|nr:tyrosine-type recombinase/integrase [Zoogloeaceae bacterium]